MTSAVFPVTQPQNLDSSSAGFTVHSKLDEGLYICLPLYFSTSTFWGSFNDGCNKSLIGLHSLPALLS